MGMDVYGLDPKAEMAKPHIDWSANPSDEEKDAYFDAYYKWEAENPGGYFRNNVWWWRPLWDFVCVSCGDFLTEDDWKLGHENSGHRIDKETALAIAERIEFLLKVKAVTKYKEERQKKLDELPQVTCHCCEGTGKGAHYSAGKPTCHVCNGTGLVDDSEKQYPFDEENVKEFGIFAKHSGGFEIC